MEQVYRIEIPIEAVDKTDTAALQRLETVLQKIFTSMKETKSESGDMFDHIARGAAEAKVAMQQMEAAAEKSAESSADAVDSAADSVDALVDTADEACVLTEGAEPLFKDDAVIYSRPFCVKRFILK